MSAPVSATVQGRELVEQFKTIDTCLANWLLALDNFDTWGAWAEDSASSCLSWLQVHCRMARSTAADKLRVARQLGRRKVLADALAAGDASYSQVRALSRVERVDDDADRELLAFAQDLNMSQLENFVRHERRIADQDRPPVDGYDKRGLYRLPGFAGGLDRLIIDATADEIERIMNLLDAFLDAEYHANRKSSMKTVGDPEESSMKTPDSSEPIPRPGIRARRVDALLDLLEHAAYENHDTIDIERAAIGVTVNYETLIDTDHGGAADLSSGAGITGEAARRLACDAAIHRIIVRGESEILDIGRKTRTWTVAQRRAIKARYNHRCGFPDCPRRIYQIHHIRWWENDGETAIDNGIPQCFHHHHLVHEGGWNINYNPDHRHHNIHRPERPTHPTPPPTSPPTPHPRRRRHMTGRLSSLSGRADRAAPPLPVFRRPTRSR